MIILFEHNKILQLGYVQAVQAGQLEIIDVEDNVYAVRPKNIWFEVKENTALDDFAMQVKQTADALDIEMLWHQSPAGSFEVSQLITVETKFTAATLVALLIVIYQHPIYFQRRGQARFEKMPADRLLQAKAAVIKRNIEKAQIQEWADLLGYGQWPASWYEALREQLIFAPDKNSIAWKAVVHAAQLKGITPLQLLTEIEQLDAYQFHVERFQFNEKWLNRPVGNNSTDFKIPQSWAASKVSAFSIDGAGTDEIDDAFSVSLITNARGERTYEIGIHIAVPAIQMDWSQLADSTLQTHASTIYLPDQKWPLLPASVINQFSLKAGKLVPALSLYFQSDSQGQLLQTRTVCEQIAVQHNLSLEQFADDTVIGPLIPEELHRPLQVLWNFTKAHQTARNARDNQRGIEYSFERVNSEWQIIERARGTPIDQLVAELMITANSVWAKQLAEHSLPAWFRVQADGGNSKLSLRVQAHAQLGVEAYAWLTSPLRRLADLFNQRQLLSLLGEADQAPWSDAEMKQALRTFENGLERNLQLQKELEQVIAYQALMAIETERPLIARRIKGDLFQVEFLPAYLRATFKEDAIPVCIAQCDLLTQTYVVEPLVAAGEIHGLAQRANAKEHLAA